ncbi:putative membrane protein [Microbacterium testaceum]|uniref:potassium transporter Trk n=1 Tax=Microbacterium TaxID=33882 RepID=UPI00277E90FD|nr:MULTISPECIES: potassium transporter Trk [Microbacterium]MDQ1111489.1 putative membrane protein [Microbacterium testaceum]MDR6097975.1 putative membrane protein [Microbacterium sp. SORGH_AS_0454]
MAEQPVPQQPSSPRDERQTLTVRRAPKYGVFLAAGAFAGILIALVLTVFVDGSAVSPYTQVVYSQMQVFGFTALIFVVLGVAVGAIVALIFERTVGGRTRQVTVEHEQHGV